MRKIIAFFITCILCTSVYSQVNIGLSERGLDNSIDQLKHDLFSTQMMKNDLSSKINSLERIIASSSKRKKKLIGIAKEELKKVKKEYGLFIEREAVLLEKIGNIENKLPINALGEAIKEKKIDINRFGKIKEYLSKQGFLGGDFAFYWGEDNRYVNISPSWNINLNTYMSLGTGVLYQYQRKSVIFQNELGFQKTAIQDQHLYGGKLLLNLQYKGLLGQLQGEVLNAQRTTVSRYWTSACWLSGGYQLKIREGLGINLLLRYNLNHQNSPYSSAFNFNIGFQIPTQK